MLRSWSALTVLALCIMAPLPALAQIDEIVVTARKVEEGIPGVFVTKTGDFMLLEVRIANDSIETETRGREINETLGKLFEAARADQNVSLAVNKDGVVLPLTEDNRRYRLDFTDCGRTDTVCATFSLRTPIPKQGANSEVLASRLEKFSENIEKIGRTKIQSVGQLEVSLVDPQQYRTELLEKILSEINLVTESLGDGHKVKVEDIDRHVGVMRSGILDVILYIPYTYTVYPDVQFTEEY